MGTAYRNDGVDALRGIAMVWMTVFHFCFDLNHFGHWQTDFYRDPFWTVQRTAIVSLFVFCAGLGQALALQNGVGWPAFWRRWRQIALGAALVTLGSYLMFPHSFIYFGILHGMAVMLLLTRCLIRWLPRGEWCLWGLGGVALVLPLLAPWAHARWPWLEVLNAPAWNGLGLVSRKPVTEDYAPLLPWLGVMWWGLATGRWVLQQRPSVLAFSGGRLVRGMAVLGRWSLPYYLLHQPVLIGALSLGQLMGF